MKEYSPGVHKLVKHLNHIQKMKNGKPVAPLHVSVWPTIRCNLKCSYCCCRNTARDANDLDYRDYCKLVNVLFNYGTKAIEFSGGGEPILWGPLSDAIRYTEDFGIKMSLITNGVYLPKLDRDTLKRLSWIRISVQSEDHLKNIDHDHLKGVKHSASFIASSSSLQGELMAVAKFCDRNKIVLRVATMKPSNSQLDEAVKAYISSLKSEYVFFADKPTGSPDGCYMAWIRGAVDWNGNFLPCPSMHLNKEYQGYIPDKFKLCTIDGLESWLQKNKVHDMGFRCSICNCGKENNDFFHKVITDVEDAEFV